MILDSDIIIDFLKNDKKTVNKIKTGINIAQNNNELYLIWSCKFLMMNGPFRSLTIHKA